MLSAELRGAAGTAGACQIDCRVGLRCAGGSPDLATYIRQANTLPTPWPDHSQKSVENPDLAGL